MNWDWEKLQEKRQGRGQGGGGSGKRPPGPDWEAWKRKLQNLPGFRFSGLGLILGLVVLIWLASGFYIVDPDQVGVVQRFGAFTRITQPGPHFHLPYPIEQVSTPSVTQIKRQEIGFRSTSDPDEIGQIEYRHVPKEALMLTGDENIVDVRFIVQYRIRDAQKYLFNISSPEKTVKDAAEAAMRDVVGKNEINPILTTAKMQIQNESQALLQQMMNDYNSGIQINAVKLQDVHPPQDVIEAFRDVASAREDRSRQINQGMAHRNQILPQARGKAASMTNEAEAYKESKIRQAKGEAQRFKDLWQEYSQAEDVTRKRFYLETMEKVLQDSEAKVLFSRDAAQQVVPYLPLEELRRPGRVKDQAKEQLIDSP
ncbi:MAG: FtsH protease activity modulator HflK [Desulfohalobiaceae bacterium]